MSWLKQRERGSRSAMRLITWIALKVGRTASRPLLYPICAYFMVFSVAPRRASRDFLSRALGRPAGVYDVFRHYHTFATTIHDRIFFLAGRSDRFDVRITGEQALEAALAQGRGCLLLGSHLGSFEVLRAVAATRTPYRVNVLMYEDNAAKINSVFDRLSPGMKSNVLPLGRPETVLQMAECLERNEIVGILGDRCVSGDRIIRCEFLGEAADFPEGPLLLALILKAPVVLFFGLYRGGSRYDGVFEPLVVSPASTDRRRRKEAVQSGVAQYAARLEHYARLAPYNWFNFYDFWNSDASMDNTALSCPDDLRRTSAGSSAVR